MACADGSLTVNLKSDMSTYKVHTVCNRYVINHAKNSLKYGRSIYQTLIEKAISINHKSQEKPVTMQVAGFFYTSAIMSKVSTAHGKSTAYVTGM